MKISLYDKVYRRLRKNKFFIFFESILFGIKNFPFRNRKILLYCLTPPPELRNIGDHAQIISIRYWLTEKFQGIRVLELDKNRTSGFVWVLKYIIKDTDLIFIHSGGNLGDRGLWSEYARRRIIATFKKNKVIQLPQTIYFSNTTIGNAELNRTIQIYGEHKNLIVTARDNISKDLAKKYFPNALVLCCPDFVLLYKRYFDIEKLLKHQIHDVLFCIRRDNESLISSEIEQNFIGQFKDLNIDFFDTTINAYIYRAKQEMYLKETISYFSRFKVVVTDRFHGVIFSLLAKRPCIIMPTVDHKLISAYKSWFSCFDKVFFTDVYDDIKLIVTDLLKDEKLDLSGFEKIDKYFEEFEEKVSTYV